MEMGMSPELMYGQNVYVPATANPYQYGYAEVGSPMEWYNHPSSLGYDSQDIYYPTEGVQCVYYAAPDNGSMHPSYSPYPVDPSFLSDGSFVTQEYIADNTNSTCQIVSPSYPPSYYIPAALPYAQDSVSGSTTTLLQPSNLAYLPTMPAYAATSVNGALPLVAPVNTKTDMVVNPPVQSIIVSSKQYEDHTKLNFQLKNSVTQKQEQLDGSMVPVNLPHVSKASVLEGPKSSAKHSPKEKLSANNCIGCAGADLQKWASAEKFQPSSKSSSNLNGSGQKLLNENDVGDSEKPNSQKSSDIIVKSHTTRLPLSNPEGTIHIRTSEYNRHDLRVDYTYAKFFVIKSIGEADVHKSIKYGVWSSSSSGNIKLDNAFRDADRISKRNNTKCPVFLFFSVNGSGHFCGMAEMVGPVDFQRDMDFWCQDKWSGCFPVRWHIVKDIPNYSLQHITLQNNEYKPVTHSRDTQEIPYIPGITVLKIFKDIKVKECLFDDFMRYEVEEARVKQYRRRKLSHNAPDFVPVSQRREVASDAQQAKVSGVLIDRTSEIQNVSEKLQDRNLIKHQDPSVESVAKQGIEAEKENGQQENLCNGKQSQQDTAKTNQAPAPSLRTGVDRKQQYWKKVENPRQLADHTAQGSSKAPEKRLNGVHSPPAGVVSETSEEQKVIAKVASLKISSKTGEADIKSCPAGVVTIGSMPVRVSEV
ncbi:hypothetical protein QOZ80_1BG0064310 [Eleusine coracana subsp. coracana]|nr:hypothetical protein QOZ80_1BG0064310 [Eleusine coracana subsp. coracana]